MRRASFTTSVLTISWIFAASVGCSAGASGPPVRGGNKSHALRYSEQTHSRYEGRVERCEGHRCTLCDDNGIERIAVEEDDRVDDVDGTVYVRVGGHIQVKSGLKHTDKVAVGLSHDGDNSFGCAGVIRFRCDTGQILGVCFGAGGCPDGGKMMNTTPPGSGSDGPSELAAPPAPVEPPPPPGP